MTADDAAVGAVKRLFFAVSVTDGEALWEELSERARAYVLNLAVQQGMDFELGSRLRTGTASAEEWRDYLENLALGVRRDVEGIDLSNLAYDCEEPDEAGRVRVRYGVPLGLTGPSSAAATIPAGSALVVQEVGRWKVDRLIPRPGS